MVPENVYFAASVRACDNIMVRMETISGLHRCHPFGVLQRHDSGYTGFFTLLLFTSSLLANLVTGFKFLKCKKIFLKKWLNIKRFLVCGLSLIVAIVSPALGTMFACTYFLMYDKKGIEEVVPSILQDQFKEFFKH